MVYADAHGGVVLAADVEEGHEALFYLFQLVGIFGVGVVDVSECAGGVDVVAGVDAHLLGVECCHVCDARVEVYVCHEGCGDGVGAQSGTDVFEVFGLACALCGEAHKLASGTDYALSLCYARLGVVGVGGRHGLHTYGVVAAHVYRSHMHEGCFAASVVEKIDHCGG